MNIISIALDTIRRSIPKEILQQAYLVNPPTLPDNSVLSLDSRIRFSVIMPRVVRDVDLRGGEIMQVDTAGMPITMSDYRTLVIVVPAERIFNRTVLACLSASYLPTSGNFNNYHAGVGYANLHSTSPAINAAARVFDAASDAPVTSTAHTELVGHNTVMIREQTRITGIYTLRLLVGSTENLSNMPLKSAHAFSKLCLLAVKSDIYNRLIIGLDRNFIESGHELGVIKDIISDYKDAEEMYQTSLKEEWAAISLLSDPTRKRRFIKVQMHPGM